MRYVVYVTPEQIRAIRQAKQAQKEDQEAEIVFLTPVTEGDPSEVIAYVLDNEGVQYNLREVERRHAKKGAFFDEG